VLTHNRTWEYDRIALEIDMWWLWLIVANYKESGEEALFFLLYIKEGYMPIRRAACMWRSQGCFQLWYDKGSLMSTLEYTGETSLSPAAQRFFDMLYSWRQQEIFAWRNTCVGRTSFELTKHLTEVRRKFNSLKGTHGIPCLFMRVGHRYKSQIDRGIMCWRFLYLIQGYNVLW
jgi:hypothetical protein